MSAKLVKQNFKYESLKRKEPTTVSQKTVTLT